MRFINSYRRKETEVRVMGVDLSFGEGGWTSGMGVFDAGRAMVFVGREHLGCRLKMGAVC